MRRIRLVVEFDGTAYQGWQRQGRRPTVQAALESAVRAVTRERVTVMGAGRTDAGVHAEGQVAAFDTTSKIPAAKFREALNANLPPDVAVIDAADAPPGFQPQFGATSKHYRYVVLNRASRPALLRDRVGLVRGKLDVDPMRAAARALVGTHDFRAFASQADRLENTRRTVKRLDVVRDGDRIVFDVEGDGFLYNMVRAVVGTLLQVGRGKRPPEDIARVLDGRDRRRAGPNAPACGLTLVSVSHD